jgi:DNA replication protein DnaC
LREQLKQLCKKLRLAYVMDHYESIPFTDREQFLYDILTAEKQEREMGKARRLMKKAGFGQVKTLDDYSFECITFPERMTAAGLLSHDFIQKRENILLLGAVGTGKTHLATALGIEACKKGHQVRFFRVADLVAILQAKFQNGTLTRFRKELGKCELLILDELGFIPFHRDGAELLFQVLSECYERNSVMVTSNLEFGQWNTVFGDNRLTAALIDRLVHHAHILAFTGESYRLRHAMSVQIV